VVARSRRHPRARRLALWGLILLVCTYCVVVAVLSLVHPGWNAYLQPYLTPPIGADHGNAGGGVGFILLPLVLVGVLAHRLWWRARVELEAHRRRGRHRS
jgi:polyferredoxin